MATKKNKMTKSKISKKSKQYSRKMRVKTRGGGCGCSGAPKFPFFSGGFPFGPPSFVDVPISAYYPLNQHVVSTDPQAPINVTDERLAPSPLYNPLSTQIGGKKTKKTKKSKKTQKGGNWMSSLNMNNALPNTTASLFGTSNIAPISEIYNNNSYVSSLNKNVTSLNDFHNAFQPIV